MFILAHKLTGFHLIMEGNRGAPLTKSVPAHHVTLPALCEKTVLQLNNYRFLSVTRNSFRGSFPSSKSSIPTTS
jgi:hypothetical protein